MIGKAERGFTFTPLVLFYGLCLIFTCLVVWLTPLPKWSVFPLSLIVTVIAILLMAVLSKLWRPRT
jgi:membrane protein YdbS with pleckstrin-like domain